MADNFNSRINISS